MDQFREWVQSVIDSKYEGKAYKLAEAIGLSPTHVGRVRQAESMGPESLLRLAALTGRNASEVFRLAKKPEWADLIEQCYGPPRPVSPAVREVVSVLDELPALAPLTARWLRELQAAWRSRSTSHSEPGERLEATTGRPAKRGARAK